MSNADELLTDARQAARRFAEIDPLKVADRLDAAEQALSLWARLDDHMSVSATPPADWPAPVAVGPITREDTGDGS